MPNPELVEGENVKVTPFDQLTPEQLTKVGELPQFSHGTGLSAQKGTTATRLTAAERDAANRAAGIRGAGVSPTGTVAPVTTSPTVTAPRTTGAPTTPTQPVPIQPTPTATPAATQPELVPSPITTPTVPLSESPATAAPVVTPITQPVFDPANPVTASPESIEEIRQLRENVQFPQLNPVNVGFGGIDPTLRELYAKGQQSKFGIPFASTLFDIARQQLPSFNRSSFALGL